LARGNPVSFQTSNTTTLGAPYVTPILDTVTTINHPSSSHPVSGEQSWAFDQIGKLVFGRYRWHDGFANSQCTESGHRDPRITHRSITTIMATKPIKPVETTNVWDAWNRGVGIRGSTFSYDALGRRVTESDSTNSQFFFYAVQTDD